MADDAEADFEKLRHLIQEVKIALLTTVDIEGRLHTRPVQTLQQDRQGDLWFFTDWHSPKVGELRQDLRVGLGYADPGKHRYIAISGRGSLIRDPHKAAELWTTEQRAWYPHGPQDERLALLRVRIERAEYWIAPGRASYLVAAAKAAASGQPAEVIGENHKLP